MDDRPHVAAIKEALVTAASVRGDVTKRGNESNSR